jgi:hypothetical protein
MIIKSIQPTAQIAPAQHRRYRQGWYSRQFWGGSTTPFKSWPSLLPMVQSALNNAIMSRLGNRSSTEVFFGLPTSTPITTAILNKKNKPVLLSMADIRARQILKIEQLQSAVDIMHKQVAGLKSKVRKTRVACITLALVCRASNLTLGTTCCAEY